MGVLAGLGVGRSRGGGGAGPGGRGGGRGGHAAPWCRCGLPAGGPAGQISCTTQVLAGNGWRRRSHRTCPPDRASPRLCREHHSRAPGRRPEARRRVHAFTDDALGEDDAVGLVARLRAGQVSRREVVDAAVARTEELDPVLSAVAAERFEQARQEAVRTTTAGSPASRRSSRTTATWPGSRRSTAPAPSPPGRPPPTGTSPASSACSAPPSWARPASRSSASAPPPSPRRPTGAQPWLTSHSSGASSAGAAVLVAGGAVPLAHANDGGGSIRIPAAVNALVGLKPTRGAPRATG